jgi:hypothetical protein
MTIPRHELPGRIVLTIGLVTSSLCVVGLIILRLGRAAADGPLAQPGCQIGE